MENKGVDRIIVTKPVASRPSSSMIRSHSGLLIGVNRESEPDAGPKTGTGPIKPKTVRFKPPLTHNPPPSILPQGDGPKTDRQPSVLYKPLAKAVSKATVSVLANMGNFEQSPRQTKPSAGARIDAIEHQPEKPLSLRSQLGSNSCRNLRDMPTTASGDRSTSLPLEDSREIPPVVGADRPYDGYNWRKYGQKQVKGSEYPRSYYKCTHPNCPVKKKVERSLDGQIAEIVYKGEHSHPKPQPPKRGLGAGQDGSNSMTGNHGVEKKDVSEGGAAGTNDINMKVALARAPDADVDMAELNRDASGGLSAEYDIDPDDRNKRRKIRNQVNGVEINGESPQEPQISVQDSVDPEILGDGFRWRKYGQKVVKGNSHPRSYYKCTSVECNVRKHVERALDDPNTFITTYEGKHNHEMPRRTTTMPSSESNPRATSKEKKPA